MWMSYLLSKSEQRVFLVFQTWNNHVNNRRFAQTSLPIIQSGCLKYGGAKICIVLAHHHLAGLLPLLKDARAP